MSIVALPAAPARAQSGVQSPEAAATAPAAAPQPSSPTPDAAAGPASGKVEEIVVTAQFREQNLQKTPIAITAVSGAMLQARSQTNLAQIAGQAPSVNLSPGNATFGDSLAISIRGVGQSDYLPAVEPGVGLYVDDVYYATLTGSILDLLDLDRIEVLRGPQGTLAGRNSIGGALKLYSKRPTDETSATLSATYGSRDRIDLRGNVNFEIAPDLDARISGVAKKQKGYVKDYDFGCRNPPGSALNPATGGIAPVNPVGTSCLLDRYGEVNYQAVRGQIRYHPGDRLDINLIGDYTHDDHSPAAAVLTNAQLPAGIDPALVQAGTNVPFDSRFTCGKSCTYSNGYAPADPAAGVVYGTTRKPSVYFDGYGFSGELEYRLTDDVKITSITAYRQYLSTFASDDDNSPLPVSQSYDELRFRFFSQELRLNGSLLDNKLLYTIGGYYSSQRTILTDIEDIRSVPFPGGLQFSSPADRVPAHSKAVFANASWNIVGGLTFNGGIRFTHEDKDYHFSRRFPDGSPGQPIVGSLDGVVGSYKKSKVDYRANLQYQWTPEIMTYAQFSTGFKGGGINPRPFFPSQAQPFSPETLKTYEIGAKTELFDRVVRLNVAAYYDQYNSIQLTLTSCPQYNPPGVPETVTTLPCNATANGGNAHLKGAEAETSIRPARGVLIDGTFSYLDFNYTSIVPGAMLGANGVRFSDVAPYQSKWKWSIGAQYTMDLTSGATLTPRVDLIYQSHFYTNPHNDAFNKIPGYALVNARLTWRGTKSGLEISAEATNLFNKYYFLNSFDNIASEGFLVKEPGRPREWALTVTKHF